MSVNPMSRATTTPARSLAVAAALAVALAGLAACGQTTRAGQARATRRGAAPAVPAAPEATPTHPVLTATNVGASVPVAASPSAGGKGFFVASTDGVVNAEGAATWRGDARSAPLDAPVVSIGSTPTGNGYWLLGGDGGVFTYGDAHFHGSTGNVRLNQPALQLVGTPTGQGYWFVARDGGVFAFGDAQFHGSTGNVHLTEPIVGMAATPRGGYWLVARDGGVFAFGDARFLGSTGKVHLTSPVVGMAAMPGGGGYWLVARDGGIFSFGDARFYGSDGSTHLPAPVVGMVATGDGHGYWLVLGNGRIDAFGDAARIASSPIASSGFSLVGQVITLDPGHDGGNGADPAFIDRLVWNGRELEMCDTAGTSTDAGYPEHAFTWDTATRLAALLRSYGATVVLTRPNDTGVGPCVDQRAAIGNRAGSDAVIDIHGDGGPPGGRGVTVLEPVADGPNDAVIGSSDALAVDVRDAFTAGTGEPVSDYDGVNGLQPRDDLAGLNLTTVPKVLIECANMRNAADAALLTDAAWRQEAAAALARGVSQYLIGFP